MSWGFALVAGSVAAALAGRFLGRVEVVRLSLKGAGFSRREAILARYLLPLPMLGLLGTVVHLLVMQVWP